VLKSDFGSEVAVNKLPGERNNPAAFTIRELEIQVQTGVPSLGLWKETGPILVLAPR
jgi:hypothetical protein